MFLNKKIQNRMLKRLLFCVLTNLYFNSTGQVILNLVSNYSFEDTIKCPNNSGQVNNSKYWFNPVGPGSPDYYNSCANSNTIAVPNGTNVMVPQNISGFQFPKTGNSYCGFATYVKNRVDFREYIKSGLKNTLINSKSYCVTFYVSRSDSSAFASANIGAYFSNDSIINPGPFPPLLINLSPHVEETTIINDSTNWVQIQKTHIANANENFITIGNFRTDGATSFSQTKPLTTSPINGNYAYYYIDDVSVIEINPASAAIKDSLISRCFMDSVMLGTDSTEFATYTWSSTPAGLAALSCANCPNPIAKPLITTKYYLTKVQCSATTMDSVTVVVLTPTTQAIAGNDKTICLGDVVQIGTQDSLAFTNYTWQNATTLSCTNCAMPFANPNVTTTYTVQRTECANVTTDTVRIIIDDCDPTFVLPNVFTPNGDEINDTWGINFSTVNSHISNFKMSIYDRWGLLVYSTNPEASTPKSKWDGRTTAGIECNAGVYFYVITFNKNEEEQKLTGHLSLFR